MEKKKTCDHYRLPFKTDCEELLGRFQQTESVRYEEFSAIWREMNFSSGLTRLVSTRMEVRPTCIKMQNVSGNQTGHEKRSFTRLTFTTVYNYFLPPYSFQIRVGALYMIYGLYNTQLVWPKETIRVALKDWYEVQKLISEAKSCQHLDVVYIFRRLLSDKVFTFTAMPKQLTFEASQRIQHDVNEEFRARSDRVAELASFEMQEEVANVHNHYERMKASSVPTSVGVTLLNLTSLLQKSTLEYQHWQHKNTAAKVKDSKKTETTQKSESSDRADLLAAIKSKSYGHLSKESKSRRHRQKKMLVSGSVTDQTLFGCKTKPTSLRARTYQNLGKSGEADPMKVWLLTRMEEDKNALKRKDQRRFKW